MKNTKPITLAFVLALTFASTAAQAQANRESHGPMHRMMQGMHHGGNANGQHAQMPGATAMLTKQDAGSAADMDLVHDLLNGHAKIKRSVKNLPDGIRTTTESDDPAVAQSIRAHVASMSARLQDGREFNIFSNSLPVLFKNRDKIKSKIEVTKTGSVVTQTSSDAKVVAALQAHAGEVSELARDGHAAMHRGMQSRMVSDQAKAKR